MRKYYVVLTGEGFNLIWRNQVCFLSSVRQTSVQNTLIKENYQIRLPKSETCFSQSPGEMSHCLTNKREFYLQPPMRRGHNFENSVEKIVSRSERAFCQREICTYCARIFPDSSPKKKGSEISKHNIQHFILSHAIVYCGDTETLLVCGWGNCVFTFLPCVNEYFSKSKCYHLECSAGIKLKNLLLESY